MIATDEELEAGEWCRKPATIEWYEEKEPEVGEWCENCKRYLLFDFNKIEKNCLNCHASILIGEEEKNVNFENKNKQLKNVFNGLCFRTLNNEIVASARAFLDRKFEIAKHGLYRKGELGGAKGRWRKWSDEKTNTHKCKWAAEYCKTKLHFYNISLEIIGGCVYFYKYRQPKPKNVMPVELKSV